LDQRNESHRNWEKVGEDMMRMVPVFAIPDRVTASFQEDEVQVVLSYDLMEEVYATSLVVQVAVEEAVVYSVASSQEEPR
jgi:hypothetical protein